MAERKLLTNATLTSLYKTGLRTTEPFITGFSIGAPTLDLMVAVPYFIWGGSTVNFSAVDVCNVTTAVASSVIRFGGFAVGSDGMPGARRFDLGTVDTSTTGVKTITSSFSLLPGWNYLTFCLQGATGVSVRAQSPGFVGWHQVMHPTTEQLTSGAGFYNYARSGITGALPDPFGTLTTIGANTYPRFELVVA